MIPLFRSVVKGFSPIFCRILMESPRDFGYSSFFRGAFEPDFDLADCLLKKEAQTSQAFPSGEGAEGRRGG